MISPVARVTPPPPPAARIVAAAALAGGGATAAVIAPPKARAAFPWRRAIVPAILVLVLAILALRGGNELNAAVDRTNAPQRTARQTAAPTLAPTTAPTIAPTVAPTVAPTIAPTVAPTARPTVAPTTPVIVADDYGNTPATATTVAPGSHSGTIAPAGDVDFFRIVIPVNTNLVAELVAQTIADAGVTIYNPSGAEVTAEVNTGLDHVGRVSYVVREAGAYFVRVRGSRPDLTGTYTLTLTTSPAR
jgi:hypothetical protein